MNLGSVSKVAEGDLHDAAHLISTGSKDSSLVMRNDGILPNTENKTKLKNRYWKNSPGGNREMI